MNPSGICSSTCTHCGKVSYQSRSDARRAARIIHPGQRMRAYRRHGAWHLTSQSALTIAAWRDRDAGVAA